METKQEFIRVILVYITSESDLQVSCACFLCQDIASRLVFFLYLFIKYNFCSFISGSYVCYILAKYVSDQSLLDFKRSGKHNFSVSLFSFLNFVCFINFIMKFSMWCQYFSWHAPHIFLHSFIATVLKWKCFYSTLKKHIKHVWYYINSSREIRSPLTLPDIYFFSLKHVYQDVF